MKIGVLGMGSIGTRHVRMLAQLGERDVVALRSGLGAARELPEDVRHVREVWDEEAFWREPLDGVIIATPTSLHVAALRRAVERGLRTFVEKPLAVEHGELPQLSADKAARVLVGFCLRFHPLVAALRQFLAAPEGGIGRLLKARLYFGTYLPGWHPTSDYRKSYASRRALGGGVLRTLSHEIDLAQHLFGRLDVIGGDLRRVSELEIDVEDAAVLVGQTAGGAQVIVELDYLNPAPTRVGTLIGSRGRLEYAFAPPAARFVGREGASVDVFSDASVQIDAMYLAQMRDFLGFLRDGSSQACSYREGLEVMRAISSVARLTAQREDAHP